MKSKVMLIRVLIIILLACCLQYNMVHAQINLKIGYELDLFSSSVNKELTRSFNELEYPFVTNGKKLRELEFLNGLNIGLSYRSKSWRTEIGWRTSARSRDAFGEKPATMSEPASSFEVDMRYRISGFYVGSEFLFDRLGVGASLGSDAFRLTSNIVESSNDKIITNQLIYSAGLHVSYQLYQSQNMAMVIRPYFKSYLKDVNHQEIYDFLDLSETISLIDRPYSIGFSILFFNGAQK